MTVLFCEHASIKFTFVSSVSQRLCVCSGIRECHQNWSHTYHVIIGCQHNNNLYHRVQTSSPWYNHHVFRCPPSLFLLYERGGRVEGPVPPLPRWSSHVLGPAVRYESDEKGLSWAKCGNEDCFTILVTDANKTFSFCLYIGFILYIHHHRI